MPFVPSELSVKMEPSANDNDHSSVDSPESSEMEVDSKCIEANEAAKPMTKCEFECGICNLEFESFEMMNNHYLEMHKFRVEFVCPKCNSGFHILQVYFEHKSSHKVEGKLLSPFNEDKVEYEVEEEVKKEDDIMEEDEVMEGGEVVEKEEVTKEEVPEPQKSGPKKRKAKIAIGPFKKRKVEKDKTEKVEDLSEFLTKIYTCDDCLFQGLPCQEFLEHCKQAHGRVPCLECGKTFLQKSYLERHKWKHAGVKPFPCDECQKSFTRKVNLNLHKKKSHYKVDSYFS